MVRKLIVRKSLSFRISISDRNFFVKVINKLYGLDYEEVISCVCRTFCCVKLICTEKIKH